MSIVSIVSAKLAKVGTVISPVLGLAGSVLCLGVLQSWPLRLLWSYGVHLISAKVVYYSYRTKKRPTHCWAIMGRCPEGLYIILIVAYGLDATTTRPDHPRLRSANLIGVLVSHQLINDQLLYNDQLLRRRCCYETRQTSRPTYACVCVWQVMWLNPDYAPRLLWDTSMGQNCSKGAEVRDVMAKAFKVKTPAWCFSRTKRVTTLHGRRKSRACRTALLPYF